MKTQKQYWLIILTALSVTLASLCAVALLFWQQLPVQEKQYFGGIVFYHFGYFFTAGFILLAAFGIAADWIFRAYVIPINRMADELDLINSVNPDLRVTVRGSHDVRRLVRIINRSAELINAHRTSREEQSNQGQQASNNDQAILETLLSDLPQGILVCNLDGRIVFYNRKVKALLLPRRDRDNGPDPNGTQWLGLGRSAYRFFDQALIQDALERMASTLATDNTPSERFLAGTHHGAVLPAELRPVLDSQHHVAGYIIYLEDRAEIMRQAEQDAKHLQSWQHQLTQSISIIKTAAELFQDESFHANREYPQMVRILGEQSQLAADLWTRKEIADKWPDTSAWPLTPISAMAWAKSMVKALGPDFNIDLKFDPEDLPARISIDIRQLNLSMAAILARVRHHCRIDTLRACVYQRDNWLYMDIIWQGPDVGDDNLARWKSRTYAEGQEGPSLGIGDIISCHGAKLWNHRPTQRPDDGGLRLLIPTLDVGDGMKNKERLTILPGPRPEFYDFDLFQQAGLSPELHQRKLIDLTYTVFDTETTGLEPSGGDEIISIGAKRIVNGRLLQEDHFSQLIDPKRHLPWESIKYHGIQPEMLVDQPTIEQVLPNFQRYVRDTVLVGHNVAFDMRMLQVKETITDIKFINPVLDTMLLSSVVHPAHEDHNLSGVAARVGVNIRGRHTSLGDAAATGEIFLKLLQLLTQKGIHTLGQAIEVSQKSYYARLKY